MPWIPLRSRGPTPGARETFPEECRIADGIMGQVNALPGSGFPVDGKPVRIDAHAGGQAPPGGFYGIGYRFSYFSSAVNKPETV